MADDKADGGAPPRNKAAVVFAIAVSLIMVAMVVSVSMFRAGAEKDQFGQVLGQNTTADGLVAEANITGVDPLKNEMQVRLTLNPEGSFDDSGLLAKPVTLYYDTLNGTKQVDFKAKKPLGSVDLAVPLVGDSISSYPWDTYSAEIELVFLTVSGSGDADGAPSTGGHATTATTAAPTPDTTVSVPTTEAEDEPAPSVPPTTVAGPGSSEPPADVPPGDEGAAGADGVGLKLVSFGGATQQTDPKTEAKPDAKATAKEPTADDFDTVVPLTLTVYKTIPAYTVVEVEGSTSDADGNEGVVSASFTVKRAGTAQAFSVAVSIVMWCLALGVLYLAISVITRRRKLELTHISVMAVVMFALPAALRSFQPGVPPPGVLSDFYSFFWCDVIVGASLIATMATYLIRKPE